ncbi:MAG: transposase [Planctomycetota bacterium]
MARIARVVVSGYPHHVTQRGVRSMAIFRDDEDRRAYLRFMAEQTDRFGVEVLAWCLMTNHVHLIAVPSDEAGLARGIGEGHKRFTRMRNFRDGVRGYLFQGRFGSCVMDEAHAVAGVRYVERNPVRARLVRKAWRYRWSSAAYHAGERATDPLVKERDLWDLGGDWKSFLEEEDEESNAALRLSTRTGRPYGEEDFVTLLEELTGRMLRRGKPGRPRRRK